MSSVCSLNSCMSPDVTSSNVSSNKVNGSIINESSGIRLRTIVPEVKKDNKYWERRRRNNEAARRSREKRRMNDMNMDNRILELSQRNKQLEQELFQMKMSNVSLTSTSSTMHYDSQTKKTKLSPIIPANESPKDKSPSTHLNGMVFPIFSTIQPVSTSNVHNSSSPAPLTNSLSTSDSIHNDNGIFQTNLLTFSNIPLLSNIIATSNCNEDSTTKPTLLLPPFQFPPKTLEQTNVSDDLILNSTNATKFTPTKSQAKKKAVESHKNCHVDVSGVLDLRIKQENSEYPFSHMEGFPADFGSMISTTQDILTDRSSHINNDGLQDLDDSLNNSFLSKLKSTSCTKDMSPLSSEYQNAETKHIYKVFRRPKISLEDKRVGYLRRYGRPSMTPQSRIQVRNEVTKIVNSENGKLHDAILCLNEEIRQLKSVLLPIVKSLSQVVPMLKRSSCTSQDSLSDH